jgi:hypothetical protein
VSERTCETCGTVENFPAQPKTELRPYGPGGGLICFSCAFATPEAEQRTQNAYVAISDAHDAAGVPNVIGKADR